MILATAGPALALPRTFVSGFGNDANPGTLTQPKRSFGSALAATDPGGEIIVLDSAGYGSVTINKSVAIIAPEGVYAGITFTSGTGIVVNAGASDVVVLRGLTLVGGPGVTTGIRFSAGGTLHIESCIISGISNVGLDCQNVADNAEVYLDDTTVQDGKFHGAVFSPGSGFTLRVSVKNSRFLNNASRGMIVTAGASAVVSDSEANGNGGPGFEVTFQGTATVTRSVVSGNFVAGVMAHSVGTINIHHGVVTKNVNDGVSVTNGPGGLGRARVSKSSVTNNGRFGLTGSPESLGNNLVRGNAGGDGGAVLVTGK